MQGQLSETHAKQRRAYERWGVDISADNAHQHEPKVIRMGAEVDGHQGTVAAPHQKRMEVAYFALWSLGLRCPPIKILLMGLGRFAWCFEFRRPLMAGFGHAEKFM